MESIRLRARVQIIGTRDKILLRLGDRCCKISPASDAVIAFINRLSQGGTREDIIATSAADSDTDTAFLNRCLDELLRRNLVEQERDAGRIDPADRERFDRYLHFLSEFETEMNSRYDLLERIRGSTVVVIGIGGQGSWVVYQLLCLGVGTLRLVDPDVVEASNLNRSILYSEQAVGQRKVDAAAQAIQAFAPRTRVEKYPLHIASPADLMPVLPGASLVIGVADTPPHRIRQWVGQACHAARVPSLQASGFRVGPFVRPGQTACAGCDWQHQRDRNPDLDALLTFQERLPRGASGLASPVAAITSGVIGLEVARFLVHARPDTENAIWEMGPLCDAKVTAVTPHPNCRICGPHASWRNTSET